MPHVVVDPKKVLSLLYDDYSRDLDSMNEDEEEDKYLPLSDDDNEDDNKPIAGKTIFICIFF